MTEKEDLKKEVKAAYGEIAKTKKTCFSCGTAKKCGESLPTATEYAINLGYSSQDLKEAVDAELGLGCGNPGAIASLKSGETVVDLGSGGGFDCFLAANKVGPSGKVIGIDMTPEMIELAKTNALKRGYTNVEFILGDIENMPVADSIADVIISNCVINLSPNKEAVFKEASRILKVGGRLAISDIVTTTELPEKIKQDIALYTGCITGATKVALLTNMMESVGFGNINIVIKEDSRSFISKWAPNSNAEDYIASAYISATKLN
eukprot:TRINITY_DN7683_c0_g1_i1.p1 TRINITY_DN7683_c0_g1~~TRINITY_DN7683_c0_g1_i1.p1  ORF type:complete len:264 (+),score=15.99 TRINITY_DN7683_c0_g1_i1:249-1040(+)